MTNLRDVEICRLQEEVRCVRAEVERLRREIGILKALLAQYEKP